MPKHVGKTNIVVWLRKIKNSKLTVKDFFTEHRVPFSKTQYYRYKRKISQGNIGSLKDHRARGNRRIITAEAEGYLKGYLSVKPTASLQEAIKAVKDQFGTEVTKAGMSRCLKRLGIARADKPRETKVQRSYAACGGFELISALACQIGWPQMVSAVIRKRVRRIKASKLWQESNPEDKRLGRSEQGRFTATYNRRREVRERRFASIENKRRTSRQ